MFTGDGSATIGVRESYFGFVRKAGFEPRGFRQISAIERPSNFLSVDISRLLHFEILHGILMFLAEPDQTPLMMLMSEHRNKPGRNA